MDIKCDECNKKIEYAEMYFKINETILCEACYIKTTLIIMGAEQKQHLDTPWKCDRCGGGLIDCMCH